ncbi:PilZ domain-containing protein [Marinospirillum celere]|uniref:PilZ domain-containing protein n=1 Tax=Marinospirillum celere TaxID=1122252 RepID=A0A1I1FNF2_9GAMM|nr:response regulator [Marinospirillum celere]SFB98550.1 PilZ domain-containing protein [Marinospirillum celere]
MLEKDIVLVVDDSATARNAIINVLRDRLYCKEIHEAADGKEALRMLKQHPEIDWIFCDWEMPVMAGDELLAAVRKDPQTAHLPFIMITSKGDRDSLVTAVQLGVTSFVIKPFTAKKLVEKVFLARGRMERRNAERIKASRGQKAQLKFANKQPVDSDMIDISLSGLLTMCNHEEVRDITIFDRMEVKVYMPHTEEEILLPCQVIRLEADPAHPSRVEEIRIATRFMPMEGTVRTQLVDYIEATRRIANREEKAVS